jgi:plastocyanin
VRQLGRVVIVVVLLAAGSACGGGDDDGDSSFAPSAGGEERTVLVDYRHDQFASAFLRYYPEVVKVHPGDVVTFRQSWTGEPHSVTLGKVVNDLFEFAPLFEKYEDEDAARAGGVTDETIAAVNAAFAKFPAMVGEGHDLFPPGAEPCFVDSYDDIPAFAPPDGPPFEGVTCPTAGRPQPRFTGRQGLYNSGFIAPDGDHANVFEVPLAADAQPGTYRYFCNYHWMDMSGTLEVVPEDEPIPSQAEVSRQGREEIKADAALALAKVDEAKHARNGKVGDLSLPLAGREVDEDFTVVVNEFLPSKVATKVGEPVTWTFDGADHTVSFNVPKYFPIFTKRKAGTVTWNPKSYEPVGWKIEEPAEEGEEGGPEGEDEGRVVDVGSWDGSGGFHSSGALSAGDRFTVTFTKPGRYPFACVLHPQMVGTVDVSK